MEFHRLPILPPRKCGHRLGVFFWEICSWLSCDMKVGQTTQLRPAICSPSKPQPSHDVHGVEILLMRSCPPTWTEDLSGSSWLCSGPQTCHLPQRAGPASSHAVQLCSDSWPFLLSTWLPSFGENLPRVQYPVDFSCQARYFLLILLICYINVQ